MENGSRGSIARGPDERASRTLPFPSPPLLPRIAPSRFREVSGSPSGSLGKFGRLNLESARRFAKTSRAVPTTISAVNGSLGRLSFPSPSLSADKQIVRQSFQARAKGAFLEGAVCDAEPDPGEPVSSAVNEVAVNFEIARQPGPAVGNEPLLT